MGFSLNNPLPSSMRSKSLSRTAIGCVAETWMRLRCDVAGLTDTETDTDMLRRRV